MHDVLTLIQGEPVSGFLDLETARPEQSLEAWAQMERARGNDRAPSLDRDDDALYTQQQALDARVGMNDWQERQFVQGTAVSPVSRSLSRDGRDMSQVDLAEVLAEQHWSDAIDNSPMLWDQGAGNLAAILSQQAQILVTVPVHSRFGVVRNHEKMRAFLRISRSQGRCNDVFTDGEQWIITASIAGHGSEWLMFACLRAQEAIFFEEWEQAELLLLRGLDGWTPLKDDDLFKGLRLSAEKQRERKRPSSGSTAWPDWSDTRERFVPTERDLELAEALRQDDIDRLLAEEKAEKRERLQARVRGRLNDGSKPTRRMKTIHKDVLVNGTWRHAVKRHERLTVDDVMRLVGKPALHFYRESGRVMVALSVTVYSREARQHVTLTESFPALPCKKDASGRTYQPSPQAWDWARSHFTGHPMTLALSKDRGLSKAEWEQLYEMDDFVDRRIVVEKGNDGRLHPRPLERDELEAAQKTDRDALARAAHALSWKDSEGKRQGRKVRLSQALDSDGQLMTVIPTRGSQVPEHLFDMVVNGLRTPAPPARRVPPHHQRLAELRVFGSTAWRCQRPAVQPSPQLEAEGRQYETLRRRFVNGNAPSNAQALLAELWDRLLA